MRFLSFQIPWFTQLCGATGAKESRKDGTSKFLSESLDFTASEARQLT